MSAIKIGEILKGEREKLGISQGELGGETFNSGYISKVEQGKIAPNAETIRMLFERLGHNPNSIAEFLVDEHAAKIQSIKEVLGTHLGRQRVQEAEKLIAKLEADEKYMEQKFSEQYILKCKASLAITKKEDLDDVLALLMDAMKISIPTFCLDDIGVKYLFTKQEVEIINLMASVNYYKGDLDKSIDILKGLKKNIDRRFMDATSKGAIYPMLIYNLTKYLGLSSRYEDALKLCNEGKDFCMEISSYAFLPHLTFNKACCLYEMGNKKGSEELVRLSYYTLVLYEKYELSEIAKNYAKEKFDIVL